MEKILRELKLESLFPKFAAQRIEPVKEKCIICNKQILMKDLRHHVFMFSLTCDLFCGRMLTVHRFFCIGRKYSLDCDPTFALRSFAVQEQFKGFNSSQPETPCNPKHNTYISNPPDSFNCGKPLISPSSPLSPHVIFSNTSCSSSSKSSLIFFMPSPAWNRTCLSVDEGILL